MRHDEEDNDEVESDPVTDLRPGKTYDVTRELRRLALEGGLKSRFPQQASALWEALCDHRRIWFSEEYQDYSPDPNRRRRQRSTPAVQEE